MLLQKYFYIHLFFSLSGISLCVQCVVGTQSCFFFPYMDDQLSLYRAFLTVYPWAAHWRWLPCWAMVLLGRKNPSLTFPLTPSSCFPFPWVSLDSLRFMLFSFVSSQSLEIGHLKFFLRNTFLEEGRERSRLLLILHIGLPWMICLYCFLLFIKALIIHIRCIKNILWILLETINLLLYSILIWIKKPWTLDCLNFYNKISFFSVTKLNYIVFSGHAIFLYSSTSVSAVLIFSGDFLPPSLLHVTLLTSMWVLIVIFIF